MPEVCRFRGIVIYCYPQDHRPPHFHAEYAGEEAQVLIADFEVAAGSLPNRQPRLVQGWAALHQEELQENWDRLREGRATLRIEPLR